jgi:hypothetical protein
MLGSTTIDLTDEGRVRVMKTIPRSQITKALQPFLPIPLPLYPQFLKRPRLLTRFIRGVFG